LLLLATTAIDCLGNVAAAIGCLLLLLPLLTAAAAAAAAAVLCYVLGA